MPWIEVRPMDQKILFIADWLRGVSTMSDLCDAYNISRKTGYKWIKRYDQSGIEGLNEANRKPLCSPHRTPYLIRQAILELRTCSSMVLGPKKIQALLEQRFPTETPPSKTTIYNILHAEGVVPKRRRRQRISPFPKPFAPVVSANDVWSADFKGQFRLQNGAYCYPLTVMDHHSRYVLCCEGLEGPRFLETQAAFRRLFKDFGLPERIRNGQFREDLYYRLNVFTLHLPPLRERREDIPALVEHFLSKSAGEVGITSAALQLLMAYSWPGNVRELQNVIERASVICESGLIETGHLPAPITSAFEKNDAPNTLNLPPGMSLDERLAEIEKNLIIEALRKTDGVQVRATELLGINQRSLWHRIKKHDIDVKSIKNGK